MAGTVSELVRLFLITFILTLHTSYVTSNPAATISSITKPQRFITKLIHHDSVQSPYYNPNASIRELVSRSRKSSAARLAYLKAKITNAITMDDTRALLVPDNSEFMANFSFGEPPVPQLVTIDTGSDLLWIQCQLPCTKCYQQDSPIFDPYNSSTYQVMSCSSPNCYLLSPADRCNLIHQCKFYLKYADGASSQGLMATEKLTFQTSDEGLSFVSDVVFGCGNTNVPAFGRAQASSGVLGLGPSPISLATKLGSKFSYCIGDIRDPKYPHNQLILGEGTKTEGAATPLEIRNELYFLTLEGISLGQSRLQIDPKVFSKTSTTDGTFIDSGTTLTYLVKPAYDVLSAEVQKLLGKLQRLQNPDAPTALCFRGTIDRDLAGFPGATFHFAGGADLVMDRNSFFEEYDNAFCMAVQMELEGLNIIGIMAQQHYNIAYDVGAKKVYFQNIDCGLLES